MKKTAIIWLAFFMLFSCQNPDINVVSSETLQIYDSIYVGIDKVIDFTSDGDYFYLLTNTEIIKVNNNGSILERTPQSNITGICFDRTDKKIQKITSAGIIIDKSGDTLLLTDISQYYGDSDIVAMPIFIAYNEQIYYSCLEIGYPPDHFSYSSQIAMFSHDGGYLSLFTFLNGIPEAIYIHKNILYYIGRNGDFIDTNYREIEGDLRKYNISDKKLIIS